MFKIIVLGGSYPIIVGFGGRTVDTYYKHPCARLDPNEQHRTIRCDQGGSIANWVFYDAIKEQLARDLIGFYESHESN